MAGVLDQRQMYASNRDYVLGVLRRRCGWLDDGDREGLFHDAFVVLLDKDEQGTLDMEGMAPHQVRAYLVQTALNKALDEGKRAGRRRSVPLGDDDGYADAASAAAQELVDGESDRQRVREIVEDLPARQQVIVKLRFFFERTPTEIQEYLGISERAYRRDFERAMRTIAEGFDLLRKGSFCESRRSLILAFVAGIAGPGRMADARRHLATCRACAAWAAQLRTAGERVGAVAPLPVLLGDDGGGRLAGLGDRAMSVVETVKHHAASLALRGDAAAPAQWAGARPGAAAAAIAGCLAFGGGATYCAVQGLPLPHRAVHHAPERTARTAPAKTRPARTTTTTPAAAVVRPAASTRTTRSAAATTTTTTAAAKHAAQRKAAAARVRRKQKENAELTFERPAATASPAPEPATGTTASTGGGGTTSGSGTTSGKWSGEFAP